MSWIRQLHKFCKQQQSIATSGKLFIRGKFSVAVINEYAINLKGNETFIKLDNGTQASMILEAVLCPIKKNTEKARDIQVKFRDYTQKPVTIKGL